MGPPPVTRKPAVQSNPSTSEQDGSGSALQTSSPSTAANPEMTSPVSPSAASAKSQNPAVKAMGGVSDFVDGLREKLDDHPGVRLLAKETSLAVIGFAVVKIHRALQHAIRQMPDKAPAPQDEALTSPDVAAPSEPSAVEQAEDIALQVAREQFQYHGTLRLWDAELVPQGGQAAFSVVRAEGGGHVFYVRTDGQSPRVLQVNSPDPYPVAYQLLRSQVERAMGPAAVGHFRDTINELASDLADSYRWDPEGFESQAQRLMASFQTISRFTWRLTDMGNAPGDKWPVAPFVQSLRQELDKSAAAPVPEAPAQVPMSDAHAAELSSLEEQARAWGEAMERNTFSSATQSAFDAWHRQALRRISELADLPELAGPEAQGTLRTIRAILIGESIESDLRAYTQANVEVRFLEEPPPVGITTGEALKGGLLFAVAVEGEVLLERIGDAVTNRQLTRLERLQDSVKAAKAAGPRMAFGALAGTATVRLVSDIIKGVYPEAMAAEATVGALSVLGPIGFGLAAYADRDKNPGRSLAWTALALNSLPSALSGLSRLGVPLGALEPAGGMVELGLTEAGLGLEGAGLLAASLPVAGAMVTVLGEGYLTDKMYKAAYTGVADLLLNQELGDEPDKLRQTLDAPQFLDERSSAGINKAVLAAQARAYNDFLAKHFLVTGGWGAFSGHARADFVDGLLKAAAMWEATGPGWAQVPGLFAAHQRGVPLTDDQEIWLGRRMREYAQRFLSAYITTTRG